MKRSYIALACALVVLSACQSMGIEPAKSFDDRLAYAYGAYTAVNTATASALDAKSITSKDAEGMQKIALEARGLLDGAKLASGSGNLADANNRLAAATVILTQLQTYIRSRGVK